MAAGFGLGAARAAAGQATVDAPGPGALRRRLCRGGGAEPRRGLAVPAARQPAPTPTRTRRADGFAAAASCWDAGIAVAMLCAMVSYALMNLVMTSTPLAVVGCGFTTANAADVVAWHVLAMLRVVVTGGLVVRFGAERVVATGLVLLACACAAGLSAGSPRALLGRRWCCSGPDGTRLHRRHRHADQRPRPGRARRCRMNDFAVFGLVCLASLASGGMMNCVGSDPVSGWTAVNLAMLPFLGHRRQRLVWLALISAGRSPAPGEPRGAAGAAAPGMPSRRPRPPDQQASACDPARTRQQRARHAPAVARAQASAAWPRCASALAASGSAAEPCAAGLELGAAASSAATPAPVREVAHHGQRSPSAPSWRAAASIRCAGGAVDVAGDGVEIGGRAVELALARVDHLVEQPRGRSAVRPPLRSPRPPMPARRAAAVDLVHSLAPPGEADRRQRRLGGDPRRAGDSSRFRA